MSDLSLDALESLFAPIQEPSDPLYPYAVSLDQVSGKGLIGARDFRLLNFITNYRIAFGVDFLRLYWVDPENRISKETYLFKDPNIAMHFKLSFL